MTDGCALFTMFYGILFVISIAHPNPTRSSVCYDFLENGVSQVAIQLFDNYIFIQQIEAIKKIQLYVDSLGKYGDSPFLYPIYGLGGLPESFSRLCAIHGGTYMLNTKVDEVLFKDGKVTGIKVGDEEAKAPLVICDPSYVM